MFISKLAPIYMTGLIASVLASPLETLAVHTEGQALAKRAEGIHLVNCRTYSLVVYCSNDSNCNFFPSDANKCVPTKGILTWEIPNGLCAFNTGESFHWNIRSNAQSQENYSVVGSGNNNERGFVIRKDDKHVMFTDPNNGEQCSSIYYAV
ncbi:hypothetical protein F5B22DRAFT_648702 [Xylaria bambusicola]|uniref:uncharacterized protein n=1 Tax=Xylaria bambusicola TaxID=326684 RepID=UPI0020089999|nr:uncharacterized protein F5B22DRAFT_648702 [Xylaria bambusicola]KAI0509681.1 hypothetical protein F5B22DRAFT_648702 [Xylaria bambusicola]